MKKTKRVCSIIGIILLVCLYASTLVFALMKSELAGRLLMASIYCTIAVPVLLYAFTLVYKLLKDKNTNDKTKP